MADSPTSALDVIAAWRPRAYSPAAVDFAREAVAGCGELRPARARTLLWCCACLARFGESVGLEAEALVLFRPSVIERFVLVALAPSPPSRRRDVRTNLRFVARHVAPLLTSPLPLPLPRNRAKTPYGAGEISAYLRLADCQPSEPRRLRLQALIALGAGAGLAGPDLRDVRGSDVSSTAGGMTVAVRGRAPRLVPVLGRYQERLAESATFAGGSFILGGLAGDRHNITNRLVSSVAGGFDLARLEVPRLRVTWLVACAARLGLPGFFQAAGFSFSQQLGDLVAAMDVPGDDAIVLLLS